MPIVPGWHTGASPLLAARCDRRSLSLPLQIIAGYHNIWSPRDAIRQKDHRIAPATRLLSDTMGPGPVET